MAPRLDLHTLLLGFVDTVYFQPPSSHKMVYPCIRYKLDTDQKRHANNYPYTQAKRYLVTVIDQNPDSEIPAQLDRLPLCVFDRHFVADDLNHFVYKLFF